jgi:hypothetical protein
MVYAMASVMHHSGGTQSGAWMRNRVKHYLNNPTAFQTFVTDI